MDIDTIINNQIAKRKLILDEITKMEQLNQILNDRTKNLERKVYDEKYVQPISKLLDDNMKLMIDIEILSRQVDLLQHKTVCNDTVPPVPPINPYLNPIPGPSGLMFAQKLTIDDNNNKKSSSKNRKGMEEDLLLEQALPQASDIKLQPCKLDIPHSHLNSNNIQDPTKQSPPIPPRPKNKCGNKTKFQNPIYERQHQQPNNNSTSGKWKCTFCTFENYENLTNCESCYHSKLPEQLANIISKNENNVFNTFHEECNNTTNQSSSSHHHHHHHHHRSSKKFLKKRK